MSIKTKLKINLGVLMTIVGYMISTELQMRYGVDIHDYFTLKM